MMTVVLGIFLAFSGGACLALAMVVQRYALSYPHPMVLIPKTKYKVSKTAVWVIGLVLYGAANGLYALSLLYGPLSLLAGVLYTYTLYTLYTLYMLYTLYPLYTLYTLYTLLAGVFTSLVIFNMIFAHLLLGEQLTRPRIYGAIIIVIGIILSIVASPSDVETGKTRICVSHV